MLDRLLGRTRREGPVAAWSIQPFSGAQLYALPGGALLGITGERYHNAEVEKTLQHALKLAPNGLDERAADLARAELGRLRWFPVELIPTPENPHDANAIEVRTQWGLVGYIDRDHAAEFRPVFDQLTKHGYGGALVAGFGRPGENQIVICLSFADSCRRHLQEEFGQVEQTRREARPAAEVGRHRQPTVHVGYEMLEVVGESAHQDTLWALSGRPHGSRVHKEVVAVLEPEPTNPYDRHAVQVLINDMPVGHLSREDAGAYLPGLLSLIDSSPTGCVGLQGVIAGGGTRNGRNASLGVFLNHDPSDFGVQHHFNATHGGLRTGYSEAQATDLQGDGYDLSWGLRLPTDDWAAADALETLLVSEREPIDRHFMLAELSKHLYRCRGSNPGALARFDAACRQHDAEMETLRPALIAKFGVVPMIEMYRQAAIRCQKSHDWRQMRWWAERGIAVYGDQAGRPDDLLDLQKRAAYATAKLEAPVRPPRSPAPPKAAAVEYLVCESCGRTFERIRVQGRKPHRCPACRSEESRAT